MKSIVLAFILLISISTFAQPVIGLQMGSVGKQAKADLPGTLKKLNEWGIRELEGGLPQGMSAEDYLKILKENNLTLVAVGSGFEDLDKDPQKVVDRARSLGAKQVICYWIPHNGDEFTIEDAKKGVAVFNKAGELLQKNGLAFGYHAHGYEFRRMKTERCSTIWRQTSIRVMRTSRWTCSGSSRAARTRLRC